MATFGTTTWAQLTPNQQAQILAFMPVLRSNVVTLAKLIDLFASINTSWTNVLAAEVELLPSGTVIPDSTGLAGALQLTTDQVQAFMAIVAEAMTFFDTTPNQTLILDAIGPANV